MMGLCSLSIRNLRNITDLSLEPSTQLNFISGLNGSGKTSVLEAIYLLSRGRSFRSAHSNRIVRHGESSLVIFGKTNDAEHHNNIGVQIKDSRFSAKLNGQFLQKSSDLALVIPLLLITPDGDKLLKGSPRQRRRFLDWGLFHVEQKFLDVWKRYNCALSHRNAALRQGSTILKSWNHQLIVIGTHLDEQRRAYARQLSVMAQDSFRQLINIDAVQFKYLSGWNRGQTFAESIDNNIENDIKVGFTQRGPHRADLLMLINGKPAVEYLSGGQQKLAACALYLAQAHLFSTLTNKPCTLLVDDLPSELDSNHRKALLDILYSNKGQVFITTTDILTLDISNYQNTKVFHVEHGNLVQ